LPHSSLFQDTEITKPDYSYFFCKCLTSALSLIHSLQMQGLL